MKKISLLIVSLLLLPLVANAATLPSVKTLDATTTGSTISYNGTVEDGSYAVMCKLYDKDDKEIDLLSSAVSSNAFEGEFTVSETGKYTVSCANYEGGEIKSVEVEIITSNEETPNTIDKILLYVIIALISVVGLGLLAFYFRKANKNVKSE